MAFAAPDPNQVIPGQLNPAMNQAQSQAPVSAGGAGVGGAAKAAATPGQNIPAQPSAQLSAYLGANQPQAAAFAGNIANTLSGQTAAAGNAIQPAVNTYTGQQYTVPTDTTVNNAVASSPSSLTPEQQSTYKAELGAAGNAPNSANTFETTAPYQDLTQGIQGAVEQANLWNSGNNVANLSTALSPFEGQNVTQGGKTLDSLLLSQVPGAYSKIQKAVAPAANLQSYLTAGTKQADTALQNAIAQDQAATNSALGASNSYLSNLTPAINNQITAAEDKLAAQNAAILGDVGTQTLTSATPEDLQALGITPAQWQSLVSGSAPLPAYTGITAAAPNLASYLNQTSPQNTTLINAANAATPQQYSDVKMLTDLLGSNAPTSLPLDAANAAQAGVLPTPAAFNSYNTGGAFGAIQAYLQAAKNAGVSVPNIYNPPPTATNPAPTPIIGGIKPINAGI